MKRKRWIVYLGLLVVLSVGITLVIKIKRNKNDNQTIKEVVPTYGKIQSFISTTGTVQPQNRLEIKPPIGGRIEEILVREGEEVRTGQMLPGRRTSKR